MKFKIGFAVISFFEEKLFENWKKNFERIEQKYWWGKIQISNFTRN